MKRRKTRYIEKKSENKLVVLIQISEKQTVTEMMNDVRRYLTTEFPENVKFKIFTTADHHIYLYSEPYTEDFTRAVADMLKSQYGHLPHYRIGVGRI